MRKLKTEARPIREGPALPTLSADDLQTTSADLLENATALYPKLPLHQIMPHIIEMADEEFLSQLDASLRLRHFVRLYRQDRVRKAREMRESAWLFPEIRELALTLPLRVKIGDETVAREQLSYTQLGELLKTLNADDKNRHKNNPRIHAVKELRKGWPKKLRRSRMTLAEVDAVKARPRANRQSIS